MRGCCDLALLVAIALSPGAAALPQEDDGSAQTLSVSQSGALPQEDDGSTQTLSVSEAIAVEEDEQRGRDCLPALGPGLASARVF